MPSVTNNSATITPVTVALTYRFVVGVDTHAATHSYAILDSIGALLDEQTFPTTAAGIGRARDWIARRTDGDIDSVLVAVEGTGSYGAVLAEDLEASRLLCRTYEGRGDAVVCGHARSERMSCRGWSAGGRGSCPTD